MSATVIFWGPNTDIQSCIAVRSLTCQTATGTHMPYRMDRTVLPATRQRWYSRFYPSRSWYSIERPRRDARLSWPSARKGGKHAQHALRINAVAIFFSIRLSLTVTKLCHIKRSHLVNFYISLLKRENCDVFVTVWFSPQNLACWCKTCLSNASPLKINFNDPRWQTRIIIKYCNVLIFKIVAIRYLGIFKLKIFNSLHFRDTFCVITLNFVELWRTVAEMLQFFAFF